MKKILAVSLALAALAAPALAQDDAAYSVNTIGVIKYTIPPQGQQICISMPLNPSPDNPDNIWGKTSLATQVEPGSKVYFWDDQTQQWTPFTRMASGRWNATASNRVMQPGEAIFLQSPASATSDHVVSFIGELSQEDTESLTVSGGNALNARGYSMYPVGNKFGNVALATNVTPGSKVYFWSVDGQNWQPYTRMASGRWNATASNHVVNVGDGIFIQDAGSARELTETRPFSF